MTYDLRLAAVGLPGSHSSVALDRFSSSLGEPLLLRKLAVVVLRNVPSRGIFADTAPLRSFQFASCAMAFESCLVDRSRCVRAANSLDADTALPQQVIKRIVRSSRRRHDDG